MLESGDPSIQRVPTELYAMESSGTMMCHSLHRKKNIR